MTIGGMTRAQLESNVALSRGYVVKQEAIIVLLARHGHLESLVTARKILETMHGHLAIEIEMLAGMKPD